LTNFLSESDFEAFLNSLRQLLATNTKRLGETNRSLSMPIDGFVELFRLTYGSALRISETLTVYPGDIDFEKGILTLNQTKTGYKRCPSCRGKNAVDHCKRCNGLGKIRRAQRTTIHPNYADSLRVYVQTMTPDKPLFSTNRFTLWSYAKQAGKLAKLNVFEQQDERLIEGVWTHLFRKSRAQQMMLDKHEDESSDFVWELVKLKLRHRS
jgi:integrase